jgi:hypothetical protein
MEGQDIQRYLFTTPCDAYPLICLRSSVAKQDRHSLVVHFIVSSPRHQEVTRIDPD